MIIIPAKFQPSNFTGTAGKCVDRWTDGNAIFIANRNEHNTNHNDFSKLSPSLCSGGIIFLPYLDDLFFILTF